MKVWSKVAPCIYRHNPTGALYERSGAGGKIFCRLVSHKVSDAREELIEVRARRGRIERGIDRAPDDKNDQTVTKVIGSYLAADCPDRNNAARITKTQSEEKRRCKILLGFFSREKVRDLGSDLCSAFADWRMRRVKKGCSGRKTIDDELITLGNALEFSGHSRSMIRDRRKYYQSSKARKSRDCAPDGGDELHDIVAKIFQWEKRRAVLGWQALFEAFTGCRTSEVICWRMDTQSRGEPGFIENNKWLWLHRAKKGVNPWVSLDGRTELLELIKAHHEWHQTYVGDSKWWFPSAIGKGDSHVSPFALTHKLGAMHSCGDIRKKITSHGMRAFYVLVRRSQGVSDGQIAAEIGDRTVSLIETTYGAVPDNWRGGNQVSFMPSGRPAWESIIHSVIHSKPRISRKTTQPENVIPINKIEQSRVVSQHTQVN